MDIPELLFEKLRKVTASSHRSLSIEMVLNTIRKINYYDITCTR